MVAQAWLERMLEAPASLLYLVMALAATLENFIPPIPADVIILFGGFLLGKRGAEVWLAALIVWMGNVTGALAMYGIGRRYGMRFFQGRLGSRFLKPRQLASLGQFYQRYGFVVIFFSRFVPMFRAIVPVFAGVSHLRFWRTAIPLAIASGIWYGALVFLGAAAGDNWEVIARDLAVAGRWLYVIAIIFAALLVAWWWRSRSEDSAL